jgi:hypothetical protein
MKGKAGKFQDVFDYFLDYEDDSEESTTKAPMKEVSNATSKKISFKVGID